MTSTHSEFSIISSFSFIIILSFSWYNKHHEKKSFVISFGSLLCCLVFGWRLLWRGRVWCCCSNGEKRAWSSIFKYTRLCWEMVEWLRSLSGSLWVDTNSGTTFLTLHTVHKPYQKMWMSKLMPFSLSDCWDSGFTISNLFLSGSSFAFVYSWNSRKKLITWNICSFEWIFVLW